MIKLQQISKTIFSKNHQSSQIILHDINLTIEKGEFIAIVGPSGSGKSTLLNIIGLLDHDYTGQYYLNNKVVTNFSDQKISQLRNTRIGFIFQNFKLLPEYTVSENIKLPSLYSGHKMTDDPHIRHLLSLVDLTSKENDYPTNLSGGQQQRIAIARALVNDPDIIIADEPTGALDSRMSTKILTILKTINQTGKTIIMVTHSATAAAYANRQIQITDGLLTEI